jgi:pilus assembly protein Flp/PilA
MAVISSETYIDEEVGWQLKPSSPHQPAATTKELIMKTLLRFAQDDAGVTAIEYGLIAGLIAVVIITAVTLIGTNLQTKFDAIAAAL